MLRSFNKSVDIYIQPTKMRQWDFKRTEEHDFGLIRSSSSNWSNFTLDRKFTCVPLISPFVHSVRFTLVIVQSTLFIYCFQGVISRLRSFFRSRIICDSVLWLPAADTSNHRRQCKRPQRKERPNLHKNLRTRKINFFNTHSFSGSKSSKRKLRLFKQFI